MHYKLVDETATRSARRVAGSRCPKGWALELTPIPMSSGFTGWK